MNTTNKYEVFIPFNVPSSKNSKQWTGKHLIWSKKAQEYVKLTTDYWKEYAESFSNVFSLERNKQNTSVPVEFLFIRGTRHKFDYVNPLQTVLDLMVRFNWIEDDNSDIILPIFIPYEYNKENPGVEISIILT